MLSPGSYHLIVPKGKAENLLFRKRLLALCDEKPQYRAAVIEMCRLDILFFVNAFVFQVNPKEVGAEVGPFVTWGFQDEALLATLKRLFADQDDMLWEKSREMGATWLALIMLDWLCLFHPWKKFLCVSHSELAVDRAGDPDSLFWKVQFMHQHLPGWLLRGARKRKLGFAYPATNSSLNGSASTDRAGVGGRATGVLLDEFSKQRQAADILGQTADTGPRLFVGTHYQVGSVFHTLTKRPDLRKIVMHWTQHPEKWKGAYRFDQPTNQIEVLDTDYDYPPDFDFVYSEQPLGEHAKGIRSPWYDRECLRRASVRDVAIHLDINPEQAQSQWFNALTIRALIGAYCCPPYWEGEIHYDPDSGKPDRLVELPGGPLKLWVRPRPDGSVPPSTYVAGADLSTGNGATNSVLSFMDARTGEKVLEFASPNHTEEQMAPLAVALCWTFKDALGEPALFCWEHHGPGARFGLRVVRMGYTNYYRRKANEMLAGGKVSDVPGWFPSADMMDLLLREYRAGLDSRECVNRSVEAMKETGPWRYDEKGHADHPQLSGGDDPTGARINHGDRVVADALAWKMVKQVGLVGSKAKPVEIDGPKPGSFAWRRVLREDRQRASELW